jgi:hypothetical protein
MRAQRCAVCDAVQMSPRKCLSDIDASHSWARVIVLRPRLTVEAHNGSDPNDRGKVSAVNGTHLVTQLTAVTSARMSRSEHEAGQ